FCSSDGYLVFATPEQGTSRFTYLSDHLCGVTLDLAAIPSIDTVGDRRLRPRSQRCECLCANRRRHILTLREGDQRFEFFGSTNAETGIDRAAQQRFRGEACLAQSRGQRRQSRFYGPVVVYSPGRLRHNVFVFVVQEQG